MASRAPHGDTHGDLRRDDVEVVYRALLGREATPDDVGEWLPSGSLRALLDGVVSSEEYAARMAEKGQGGGDLRRDDVELIFRELLGRDATAGDFDLWLASGSLRAFLDGVVASDEYAARAAQRERASAVGPQRPYLNCWIEGWEAFARPPGDVSPDGVAIVGQRGQLFICGGSNDNVATYLGEVELVESWLDNWRSLVSERIEQEKRRGWSAAFLVVPEKLAVYADCYPYELVPKATRPVLRLLEARLPLIYPAEELRDQRSQGETYLRTDSHLTPLGNRILAAATVEKLGVSPDLLPVVDDDANPHLGAGDLGRHFDPPLVEVMRPMAGASRATILSDNRAEVASVGGHIGTIRVFRREDAPDSRTAVIFGDSYGFGDESYQGLAWWLAQVFSEVHFVWTPFGWDPKYVERVGAELVVCQTAERFIGRVPKVRMNVSALAREVIAGRQAVSEDRVFSDRSQRTRARDALSGLRSLAGRPSSTDEPEAHDD